MNATYIPPPPPLPDLNAEKVWDQKKVTKDYKKQKKWFSDYMEKCELRLVKIEKDGNSFYRAVADQLKGDQEKHEKIRKKTVKYMEENKEKFWKSCPGTWEEYSAKAAKVGHYAGRPEMSAVCKNFDINLIIH